MQQRNLFWECVCFHRCVSHALRKEGSEESYSPQIQLSPRPQRKRLGQPFHPCNYFIQKYFLEFPGGPVRLGLGTAFTAKGSGSIPGWRTKIPQAVQHRQKNQYFLSAFSLPDSAVGSSALSPRLPSPHLRRPLCDPP